MRVIRISPAGFAANSYAVTSDGKDALVVDPAQSRVAAELKKLGLRPVWILLTHAHFDHVGGVDRLKVEGAKLLCSETESSLIGTPADLCEAFGAPSSRFSADGTFSDGETKRLCGLNVTAIFTPGHTSGSTCYLVSEENTGDRVLFTGDTLFAGSVGRTDFPTGDGAALRESLRKLSALPGDMRVLPGHEDETTLETELRENPWMCG